MFVGETGGLVRITAFSDTGEEKTQTVQLNEPLTDTFEVLGKSTNAPGQQKKNDNTENKSQNNKS